MGRCHASIDLRALRPHAARQGQQQRHTHTTRARTREARAATTSGEGATVLGPSPGRKLNQPPGVDRRTTPTCKNLSPNTHFRCHNGQSTISSFQARRDEACDITPLMTAAITPRPRRFSGRNSIRLGVESADAGGAAGYTRLPRTRAKNHAQPFSRTSMSTVRTVGIADHRPVRSRPIAASGGPGSPPCPEATGHHRRSSDGPARPLAFRLPTTPKNPLAAGRGLGRATDNSDNTAASDGAPGDWAADDMPHPRQSGAESTRETVGHRRPFARRGNNQAGWSIRRKRSLPPAAAIHPSRRPLATDPRIRPHPAYTPAPSPNRVLVVAFRWGRIRLV